MQRRRLKAFDALREFVGDQPEFSDEDAIPRAWRQFNEAIGLPMLPSTNLPHRLLSYQDDAGSYKGKDLIVNKANKIGMTEAILRDLAFKGTVGDCVGYQMMLGAQRREMAFENMRRLQHIFDGSAILRPLVKEKKQSRLILSNDTEYLVMPRSPAAMRGWPRLKYAFLDEAAHYGLLDDQEFLAATTSRLSNTDGYLRVVSTPKGQRGFFWQQCMAAQQDPQSPFAYRQWDFHVALGVMVTEEFIAKERARLGTLFSQEYECAFLSAQNAAIEQELIEKSKTDRASDEW